MNIFNFLQGKKTYVVAALTAAVASAQALGYDIPPFILTALGATGLCTVRMGIAGK